MCPQRDPALGFRCTPLPGRRKLLRAGNPKAALLASEIPRIADARGARGRRMLQFGGSRAVTDARPERTVDSAWRGFAARFLVAFVAVLALTLAFVVLIDPYDSGRFTTLGIVGISD